MSRKHLHLQVIECRGVLEGGASKPYVTVTQMGLGYPKSTECRKGVECWKKNMIFKIKYVEHDWINIEVKNKGLLSSRWIGDLPLKVNDFNDGAMHEFWYKLGKGFWRYPSAQPYGWIHVAIQILDTLEPLDNQEYEYSSFEEWKSREPSCIEFDQHRFGMEYPTIQSAITFIPLHDIKLRSKRLTYTLDQIDEIKASISDFWVHKGNIEQCQGKIYMVPVDGSTSSMIAFDNLLNTILTNDDHVFLVTVRQRFLDVQHRTLVHYEIRKVAVDIISRYERRLVEQFPMVEYSSMVPLDYDARQTVSKLAKKHKVDVLVIGKHAHGEVTFARRGEFFRSFSRYCQGHAGCSVMVFGNGGTQPVESYVRNK